MPAQHVHERLHDTCKNFQMVSVRVWMLFGEPSIRYRDYEVLRSWSEAVHFDLNHISMKSFLSQN